MLNSGGTKRTTSASPESRRRGLADEAVDAVRRLMKPLEQVGVVGFFSLTLVLFLLLFCCVYLDYWSIVPRRAAGDGSGGAGSWGLGVEIGVAQTVRVGHAEKRGGGEECDWFDGEWVWDEKYPLYESKDCGFLDGGFRCSENGRPDRFYTQWRWQPKHCNLPRFDAKNMLEKLRNQRLVFVGDSIGRNQWESLLCMLSLAVPDKSSIYEVNGSPITKHKGFLVFKFRDYNCTVEYYRAPFLVVQGRAPKGAPEMVKTTLKLDILDWSSRQWKGADMLIFNTGHWWNYEKTLRGGCYFQVGKQVMREMSVDSAYQRSIATLFNWVRTEVNPNKTQVFFRSYAPVHFRGGNWKTGGSCHLETLPELSASPLSLKPWARLLEPFRNLSSGPSTETQLPKLELLNVTEMTARRRDGHLSLYYLGTGGPAPIHRQDCSHWCLPGVPDTWNELLYAHIIARESRIHKNTTISATKRLEAS